MPSVQMQMPTQQPQQPQRPQSPRAQEHAHLAPPCYLLHKLDPRIAFPRPASFFQPQVEWLTHPH